MPSWTLETRGKQPFYRRARPQADSFITGAMEDDAALARKVRAAREVEKRVLDALRQDGTFDALRRRLVEEASAKQELRGAVSTALANSATVARIDPARKPTEKELVDALREEEVAVDEDKEVRVKLEDTVMEAFSKELWDLMTDEQEGLGRELYEAVYAARERLALSENDQ